VQSITGPVFSGQPEDLLQRVSLSAYPETDSLRSVLTLSNRRVVFRSEQLASVPYNIGMQDTSTKIVLSGSFWGVFCKFFTVSSTGSTAAAISVEVT
jgi:hypothetical protein